MYHTSLVQAPMVASEDLNQDGSVGHAVELVSGQNFKIAYAQAGGGFGVLQNQPKAGEHASVAIAGEPQVRVGKAVSAGDFAMVANSGWFINVASTTSARIMGRFMTNAASGMLATLGIQKFTGATA